MLVQLFWLQRSCPTRPQCLPWPPAPLTLSLSLPRMEESALRQELKACQAQLQDLQLKRDEVLKASLEIARGTDQLLGLARALRAAPQEEVGWWCRAGWEQRLAPVGATPCAVTCPLVAPG